MQQLLQKINNRYSQRLQNKWRQSRFAKDWRQKSPNSDKRACYPPPLSEFLRPANTK